MEIENIIFKKEELNGIQNATPELQRKAIQIKQKFDLRRNSYSSKTSLQ
jgi:hypothetical protein